MALTSRNDNQKPGDLIDVSKALALLTADFLSIRRSKQLLLDLLVSGRLPAFGTQEFTASIVSDGTPGVERIEADFWLGMDEIWDDPGQGFRTGRFMSSGTRSPHDSRVYTNHRSSSVCDEEESEVSDNGNDGAELEGGSVHPVFYRDVQLSRGQLDKILNQLDLALNSVNLDCEEEENVGEIQVTQVGRKMSKQWPVWIGQACKLAYEHRFRSNTSPNQIVELVSDALEGQTLARSTVRQAAEEIMKAIKNSSVQHRFGT